MRASRTVRAPSVLSSKEQRPLAAAGSAPARVIKHFRRRLEELGLTLGDVASQTGLSISFLSQVERGQRAPSIATYERPKNPATLANNHLGAELAGNSITGAVIFSGTSGVPLNYEDRVPELEAKHDHV